MPGIFAVCRLHFRLARRAGYDDTYLGPNDLQYFQHNHFIRID